MDNHRSWFNTFRHTKHYSFLKKQPLAYFSIEYALSDQLPTYAGGLGVLAGDYVRELHDQRIPAVAVGLLYQSKYGTQNQSADESEYNISSLENILSPVQYDDHKELRVQIPITDHTVYARAWLWKHNTIPVYLLDTNVTQNSPEDRKICDKLYTSDKERRLKQELVLGIGGYRLLEALHIEPSIFHMNEGHSVMLALEILCHEMRKRKISFSEALKLSLHHVVFTNHTLVPGGNEVFAQDLLNFMLDRFAAELEIPVTEITDLGLIPDSSTFSMTRFALRLAGKINGVSKLHASLAAKVWPDYSIEAVTNGIHLPTWDTLLNTSSIPSTPHHPSNTFPAHQNLMPAHQKNKRTLLNYLKERTGLVWKEDHLVLGWARRIVRYKRPLALFEDTEKLVRLAERAKEPVRIIISGIAHQSDEAGHEMIRSIEETIKKKLPTVAVYLPGYTTQLAGLLTSGCDVWLNTPVVGSEACGTSGMKACLNGVLPLTTKDGWFDEVEIRDIGWQLDNDHVSESLYTRIERDIIPLYYAQASEEWHTKMQNSRMLMQNHYSTTRMLREYIEKMYVPIIATSYSHYLS